MLLMVAEKHDQAIDYANALEGEITQKNKYVYQVRKSKILPQYPEIHIVFLQGHLYQLKEPSEYNPEWGGKWQVNTLPIFPQKMEFKLPKQFKVRRDVIAEEIEKSTEVWLATDSDVEGENLGYIFLMHNRGLEKLNGRVWQNSQTKAGLAKAFTSVKNPKETIGNAHAGYCRMIADWLIGFNYTRLITVLLNQRGYDGLFSVGRVQTPTLALIAQRRLERVTFKEQVTYRLTITDQYGLTLLAEKVRGSYSSLEEANSANDSLISQQFTIESAEMVQKAHSAPSLYETGIVQGYLVKRCGISSKSALDDVLEVMYNAKNIISYPRTDCNLLTMDDFDELKDRLPEYVACFEEITGQRISHLMTNLAPRKKYVDFSGEKVQKVGHHALTPDQPISAAYFSSKLNHNEQVAYMYILRSVLRMFSADYEFKENMVIVEAGSLQYTGKWVQDISSDDWRLLKEKTETKTNAEEIESNEINIKNYQIGEKLPIQTLGTKREKTTPPNAITEANLIGTVMPKYHLGTQSSRADVISRLEKIEAIVIAKKADAKNKIVKNEFIPTNKGLVLLQAMESTNLLDLSTVQSWEDKMTRIAQDDEQVNGFLKEIKLAIYDDINKLPAQAMKLSIPAPAKKERVNNLVKQQIQVTCPKCKTNNLELIEFDKNQEHHQFYGCSNHKCKTQFSRRLAGVDIMPNDLEAIFSGTFGKHKFLSKRGKEFEADLIYSRGKIKFDFGEDMPKTKIKGRKSKYTANYKKQSSWEKRA